MTLFPLGAQIAKTSSKIVGQHKRKGPLKGYIGPCDPFKGIYRRLWCAGREVIWGFWGFEHVFFTVGAYFGPPCELQRQQKNLTYSRAETDRSVPTSSPMDIFLRRKSFSKMTPPPPFLPRQNNQFPKNPIPCVYTDPLSQKSETPPERSATANYIDSLMFVSMTWKSNLKKMFLESAKSLISGWWKIQISNIQHFFLYYW